MKFQSCEKLLNVLNILQWALLLAPCQLQSHGLWYSKKHLRCLFRQRVTLHFEHTTVLNVLELGTQFLHRSRLVVTSGKCPTLSLRTSSWGCLGVTFLFFTKGVGRLVGPILVLFLQKSGFLIGWQ